MPNLAARTTNLVTVAALVLAVTCTILASGLYVAHADTHSLPLKSTATIDGAVITGGATMDRSFGFSVSDIGDIDGDGVRDVLGGAPGLPNTSVYGNAYVVLLNSDGSVKDTILINHRTPNGPVGVQIGDRFGASVASIGDLDGDGIPDIAAGAPGSLVGPADAGDAYVMLMNRDGTIKRTVTINNTTPNGPSITAGDRFGTSIASLGDLDGDGIPDIAAGAPGHAVGGVTTGDVYVMLMNSDGTVKRTVEINGQVPNGPVGLTNNGLFGWSVGSVGDLDNDGVPDVAIGAPGQVLNPAYVGDLYVVLLNTDGTVKRTVTINNTTPNGPSITAGDRFGQSVAGIGDLDGDGIPEVAVGAPGNPLAGKLRGSAFILYMNADGTIKRTVTINEQTPNTPPNMNLRNQFGSSVTGMMDLDRNGTPDVAVGTFGTVFVFYMSPDGSVLRTAEVRPTILLRPDDRFGWSVASIGDIDGDGIGDIAAGAPAHATGLLSASSGKLYVLLLNDAGTVKRAIPITAQTENGPPGLMANDYFGWSVAGIGDLDGDGTPEIMAGTPGAPLLGTDSGTGDAYVMYMNADGTIKRTITINNTTPNGPSNLAVGDNFGASLAGLGDLDGDGTPDVAVGAPGRSIAGTTTGDIYVMYVNPDGTIKRTVEINAATPNGLPLGDNPRLGESLAGVGDIDGDGTPDIAVGAPGHILNATSAGSMHLILLNADGTIKRTLMINNMTPNGPVGLVTGDRFGASTAGLGDIDGDGTPDIAVGAPGHIVGGIITGDIYLMLMNADGTVKRTMELNGQTPNGPPVVSGDNFGNSVASIGDLDGDGMPEILTGASSSAYVYVSFTGTLMPMATISGTVYSDTNGNGMRDMGEPGMPNVEMLASDTSTPNNIMRATTGADGTYSFTVKPAPAVTLVRTSLPAEMLSTVPSAELSPAADQTATFDVGVGTKAEPELPWQFSLKSTRILDGLPSGDDLSVGGYFDRSVAPIGDLDRDGVPDIVIGSVTNPSVGNSTSVIYVMYMNPDGTVKRTVEINDQTPNGPVGLMPNDLFGKSVSGIGDLDGDGAPDIAVGASATNTLPGNLRGGVFLMYMNPDGTVKRTIEINDQTPNGPAGLRVGYNFGESVTGIGDLDGDGVPDILAGAPGEALLSPSIPLTQKITGYAYVMYMNPDGTVKRTVEINDQTPNGPAGLRVGYNFGKSVAGIGDLDGDGVPDILAGAPTGSYTWLTNAACAGPTPEYISCPSGTLYVMLMNPDGTVKRTVEIDRMTPNGPVGLAETNRFGLSVTSIGDLDGDSVQDVLAGSSNTIYVTLMNPNGTVKRTVELNEQTPNGPIVPLSSAAGIGDLDGDGAPEIALVASGSKAVYVSFTGTLIRTATIGGTVYSDTNGNGMRDMDEPGMPNVEMLASDTSTPNNIMRATTGADGMYSFTVKPAPAVTLVRTSLPAEMLTTVPSAELSPAADQAATFDVGVGTRTEPGPEPPSEFSLKSTVKLDGLDLTGGVDTSFGRSVAEIGDVNGDGISDVLIGSTGDPWGSINTGEAYVALLNQDGTISRSITINSNTPNVPTLLPGHAFGSSVAGLGDLDSDGIPDIAVGSRGHPASATSTGYVHVMLLNSDGTVKRTELISSDSLAGITLAGQDQFGISIANIGDRNGDGRPELAVGAPSRLSMTNTGQVYVLFLSQNGSVDRAMQINNTTPNGPQLRAGDSFGFSVANIGDIDGDGYADMAVGATEVVAPGKPSEAGTLYVMLLNSDGTVKRTLPISGGTPNAPAISTNDRFGYAAAGLGDINGDGTPDIAVGAPGSSEASGGSIHVLFMGSDGMLMDSATIRAGDANAPARPTGIFNFGTTLANIGDRNGDGRPELATAMMGSELLYVMRVNSDGSAASTAVISPTLVDSALFSAHQFGTGLDRIGDVDGDGVTDIVVGAPSVLEYGDYPGNVYVLLLNSDGTAKRTVSIGAQTANGPVVVAGDRLGQSVAGIGDINGDGIPDIAASAPGHTTSELSLSHNQGEAYVMLLNRDGTPKDTILINGLSPNGPVIPGTFYNFGQSVAGLGDIDGDGIPEIAIGASHRLNPIVTGITFVMFMNSDGTPKRTATIGAMTPNGPPLALNNGFGTSLAGIGDVDGDGTPDLAAGAPGYLVSPSGSVYLILLNPDGTIKRTVTIDSDTPNGPGTLPPFDRLGHAVAGLGDMDGDGIPDIAASAPNHLAPGSCDPWHGHWICLRGPFSTTVKGEVNIIYLNADGTPKRTDKITSQTPNGPHLPRGDHLGFSVAGLGDLDGDGTPDMAVGEPDSFSVYVLFP